MPLGAPGDEKPQNYGSMKKNKPQQPKQGFHGSASLPTLTRIASIESITNLVHELKEANQHATHRWYNTPQRKLSHAKLSRPPIRSTVITMFLGGAGLQGFLTLVNIAMTRRMPKQIKPVLREVIRRGMFFVCWIANYELLVKLYRTIRARRSKSDRLQKAQKKNSFRPVERDNSPTSHYTYATEEFGHMLREYKKDRSIPFAPRRTPRWIEVICAFGTGALSRFFLGGFSWNLSMYFMLRGLFAVWRHKLAQKPNKTEGEQKQTTALTPVFNAVNKLKDLVGRIPVPVGFGIVNSINLYYCLYKTHYVPSAYHRFATTTGNIHPPQTKAMFQDIAAGTLFPSCSGSGYHPGTCSSHLVSQFPKDLRTILRLYGVVFGVSRLAFSFPAYLYDPLKHVKALANQVLRSSLFLTLDFTISKQSVCMSKAISGNVHKPWLIHFFTFCAGLPIALENKGRQTELLLYMLWQVLQSFVYHGIKMHGQTGKNTGLMKDVVPAILFGFASAIWVWTVKVCPSKLKRMDRSVLTKLFYQPEAAVKVASVDTEHPQITRKPKKPQKSVTFAQ